MPDPRATALYVSPLQQELLQQLERRSTSPQRLVRRGKIILAATTGATNTKITQDLHVDHDTVRIKVRTLVSSRGPFAGHRSNRQDETAEASDRSAFD
jgi:DNA-binding NarL/FixJ family response regulator